MLSILHSKYLLNEKFYFLIHMNIYMYSKQMQVLCFNNCTYFFFTVTNYVLQLFSRSEWKIPIHIAHLINSQKANTDRICFTKFYILVFKINKYIKEFYVFPIWIAFSISKWYQTSCYFLIQCYVTLKKQWKVVTSISLDFNSGNQSLLSFNSVCTLA